MSDRRTLSSSLSAEVIQHLRQKRYTQAEIARMLHVSEGFISLVKSRERSLTLNHLELLSMALSIPLGEFLLAVTEHHKNEKNKEFFDSTAKIMRLGDRAIDAIMRGGTNKRSRKRVVVRK